MNNFSLKQENFWIVLLWATIFMGILAWDQEKIVVLNLILFCYFLYYLVGKNINLTLSQRRQTLLDSLLIDLNTQLNVLNNLINYSKHVVFNYTVILLSVLKKLSNYINTLLVSNGAVLFFSIYSSNFSVISQSLQLIANEINSKEFFQNTFVSSQVIFDVNPAFQLEELVTEE